MTLAALSWLNPLWGWAVPAAVAVPLVAHLLSQRGGRQVVFPAIRFIQQAADEGRRRVKLRHWLLLAVRCAALLLVVGAFARPVWTSTHAVAPGQGVTAVLVLDRSASMMQTHSGATAFDEARHHVVRMLRSLDPTRDRASVIVLDAAPRSLLPQPTANFDALIQHVEQVRGGDERGDADAALRAAAMQLRAADTAGAAPASVHVEVFTDAQATQWRDLASARQRLPADAVWRVHRLGAAPANLAIHHAAVAPAQPVVGQPTVVTAQVEQFAPADAPPQSVIVRMTVEGRSAVQVVDVPAGAAAEVEFVFRPSRQGVLLVELAIECRGMTDPLDVDNRAGRFIRIAASHRVALVTDANTDDNTTAAYYIRRALSPDTDRSKQMQAIADARVGQVTVQTVGGAKTGSSLIGSTRSPAVVVIAEAGRLDEAVLQALWRYLSDGGGVIWVIDSGDAVAALRRFNELAPRGFEPSLKLAEQITWSTNISATLSAGRFDAPILRVFSGSARSQLLRQRWRAFMRATSNPAATPPLLSFDDGSPALTVQYAGRGRLAVWAASLAPAQSTFVKDALFVPLMHQLVRHVNPGPPLAVSPRPGQRPTMRIPVGASDRPSGWHARDPADQPVAISTTAGDEHVSVQLARLNRPGPHRVLDAAGRVRGGVVAAIDPAESDLRAVDVGDNGEPAMSTTDSSAAPVLRARQNEMWPWLIVAAFALLAIESLLTVVDPRRWFGRRGGRRKSRVLEEAPA